AAATLEAARREGASFMCLRCDRVTKDDFEGLASSLCGTCRPIIASARMYPVGLIWTLAILTGPFTAGVLALLNWKRIGDKRRAWIIFAQLVALFVGAVFYGPAVFLPPVPAASLIWLFFVALFISTATAGIGPVLTAHQAAGGRTGNLFIPIGVAVALAVPAGYLWYTTFTTFAPMSILVWLLLPFIYRTYRQLRLIFAPHEA